MKELQGLRFAYNIWNEHLLRLFSLVSDKFKIPLICQVSEKVVGRRVIEPLTFRKYRDFLQAHYQHSDVWIALDHARDESTIFECIDAGWDLVMYDGTHLSIVENIANTAKLTKYAHAKGVCVEGEIGGIPGVEDDIRSVVRSVSLHDIERFLDQTQVDFFSTFIGTSHGEYKIETYPTLNTNLIRMIVDKLGMRFVVHGGSGLFPDDLRQLHDLGCSKINISTEVKNAVLKCHHDAWKIGVSEYLSWDELLLQSIINLLVSKEQAIGRMKEDNPNAKT